MALNEDTGLALDQELETAVLTAKGDVSFRPNGHRTAQLTGMTSVEQIDTLIKGLERQIETLHLVRNCLIRS